MQENNSTINLNWPLYDKFSIDDIISIYKPEYFNDRGSSPCTFTNPNCCGDSLEGSITSDACENLDNKDMQVELDFQETILTIRVIYPNGNKENFNLDFLL